VTNEAKNNCVLAGHPRPVHSLESLRNTSDHLDLDLALASKANAPGFPRWHAAFIRADIRLLPQEAVCVRRHDRPCIHEGGVWRRSEVKLLGGHQLEPTEVTAASVALRTSEDRRRVERRVARRVVGAAAQLAGDGMRCEVKKKAPTALELPRILRAERLQPLDALRLAYGPERFAPQKVFW
jgi:hypothetical protein